MTQGKSYNLLFQQRKKEETYEEKGKQKVNSDKFKTSK